MPNPYAPPAATTPQPGPYAAPGYSYGYGYAPAYGPSRTNGLAVASLVLGIVGWMACGVGSILAIIFGAIARNQIRASGGQESGEGMAKAGIILGCVFIGLIAVYFVLLIVLAAASSSGT